MVNRRSISIALICLVCLVVLLVFPEIIATLIAFVFMGVIPGTQLTVPSWITLAVLIAAVVAGVRWVMDEPIYRSYMTPKDLARRASARRRVLRRTSAHAAKAAPAVPALQKQAAKAKV